MVEGSEFRSLRRLEMLMLHGNDITTIEPGAFYSLRSLQVDFFFFVYVYVCVSVSNMVWSFGMATLNMGQSIFIKKLHILKNLLVYGGQSSTLS